MKFGIKTPPQHCTWQQMSDVWQAADAIDVFDVTFDFRHEVFSRCNSPHIQCGPQGASQSTGNTCNHVIQCGGILGARNLSPVLILIEMLDSAVDAKVQWLVKVLDVSGAMWSGMFFNAKATGVSDRHD